MNVEYYSRKILEVYPKAGCLWGGDSWAVIVDTKAVSENRNIITLSRWHKDSDDAIREAGDKLGNNWKTNDEIF